MMKYFIGHSDPCLILKFKMISALRHPPPLPLHSPPLSKICRSTPWKPKNRPSRRRRSTRARGRDSSTTCFQILRRSDACCGSCKEWTERSVYVIQPNKAKTLLKGTLHSLTAPKQWYSCLFSFNKVLSILAEISLPCFLISLIPLYSCPAKCQSPQKYYSFSDQVGLNHDFGSRHGSCP